MGVYRPQTPAGKPAAGVFYFDKILELGLTQVAGLGKTRRAVGLRQLPGFASRVMWDLG